jgi:hypothetical protein
LSISFLTISSKLCGDREKYALNNSIAEAVSGLEGSF